VAGQSSKRSARKRRQRGAGPKAVPSHRREQRVAQQADTERERRAAQRTLGKVGERPPSPFGGLPVSEFAIFVGIIALLVWYFAGFGTAVLVVGIIVIVLAVVEITAREHFSGFRSHTTLLAAIPAVGVAALAVKLTGEKAGDAPLIALAVPVFLLLFWPLRRRFQTARQARITRR
jgi:Flp pilus assembly protein TadB